ncbi:hypothetical protein [Niallia nealsonii]|uniref:hypothetical protein n=1 Tax=Niallia nealsonii TaxID=115979 RepID=UPI0038B3B1E4
MLMFQGKSSEAGVSSFQALSIVLSGLVATAIAFGDLVQIVGFGLWSLLEYPRHLLRLS